MTVLLNKLHDFCESHGYDKNYWIAYSGGLDSTVLLALCDELTKKQRINFRVIHVNHQLNAKANEWAHFARRVSQSYQFPFIEKTLTDTKKKNESIEEYARRGRHDIFATVLNEDDIILTAHHEEDQAETVLLQLLRGSGIKGLSAMPALKPLAKGYLGRPFLSCAKSEILAYAKEKALSWVEDDSNQNMAFSRNYLRHQVMPLLKSRFPKAAQLLSRTAANCALSEEVLAECLTLQKVNGSKPNTLSISKLKALGSASCKMMLREWIRQQTNISPIHQAIDEIGKTIFASKSDKMPLVIIQRNFAVRRYRDDIYLGKCHEALPIREEYVWVLKEKCIIDNIGYLEASPSEDGDLPLSIERLFVRFLPPSEVINVLGRSRHSLKKLFQEWGVPPWLRPKTPLIFLADELIAVPGYYCSNALKQHDAKLQLKIIFHKFE